MGALSRGFRRVSDPVGQCDLFCRSLQDGQCRCRTGKFLGGKQCHGNRGLCGCQAHFSDFDSSRGESGVLSCFVLVDAERGV